jgi:hypothetical protein
VSITEGSSSAEEMAGATDRNGPANAFTLRDLYVRASISGNSLATELDLYLNGVEATSPQSNESSRPRNFVEPTTVHEKALAAILEVVISNSNSSIDYVKVPEPRGGVQEWWARMLSGSMNDAMSNVRAQPANGPVH